MEICLSNLPNELLEIILFYVIGQPWKDDVRDFLSFTSTCQTFRRFVHDERYWNIMSLRRDSTCENPPENINWFEHCKQIYSQRTIPKHELKVSISRYNNNYFCTIEKVVIWPNKIRIYIDERGDNSLGAIQDPSYSIIAFVDDNHSVYDRPTGVSSNDSHFSIADNRRQYLGYLDFPCSISLDNIGKNLIFQYGGSGYKNAKLFHIDQTFINKYNLIPLFKSLENIPKLNLLIQTKST